MTQTDMAAHGSKRLTVDLQVACDAASLPSASDIEECLELAMSRSGMESSAEAEICVRIVDETEILKLNKTYRGKDRPTNVLAFPADLNAMPGLPLDGRHLLGDLVVCAPVVAREAEEQGKDRAAHWCHMLVHGLLHLLGYDHATVADARRMEAVEIDVLAQRGLENPYKTTRVS